MSKIELEELIDFDQLIELEKVINVEFKTNNLKAIGTFSLHITWTSACGTKRSLFKLTHSHINNLFDCCPDYHWFRTQEIVGAEILRRKTGSWKKLIELSKEYAKNPEVWRMDIRFDFGNNN